MYKNGTPNNKLDAPFFMSLSRVLSNTLRVLSNEVRPL